MYNYDSGGPNDPQYIAAYRQAERRVRAKIGFYWHLASYVIVNGLLIIIYLVTGPVPGFYSYPWFVWPMFGWGIGLLFHYLGVFVFSNVNSDESRRRMIEAEMRRMGAYPPPPGNSPFQGNNPSTPYTTGNPPTQFNTPPDQR